MDEYTISLISATTAIHIILFWKKIILTIKDKIQYILALPKKPFLGLTLIGKTLLRNLLAFPYIYIDQHDAVIKVFSTF